ncbi:hypothetical protein TNCV_1823781 [Trichonephila clavipes]|nr:hypothetical protein TNCV_1823781 [Trichonephila clavipes]
MAAQDVTFLGEGFRDEETAKCGFSIRKMHQFCPVDETIRIEISLIREPNVSNIDFACFQFHRHCVPESFACINGISIQSLAGRKVVGYVRKY